MKRQIRVIGVDDSPFNKKSSKKVLVVGTIYRGGDFMDGLVSTKVKRDGNDATLKIISMITNSKFHPQLQAIFLNGIAVAGFNIVDLERLYKETKIPVITIIRKYPDFKRIKETLKLIKLEKRYSLIEKAPRVEKYKNIYFQKVGLTSDDTRKVLKICIKNADIPECLRTAHIIGAGIANGESSGHA